MSFEYQIIPYQPDFRDQVIELQKHGALAIAASGDDAAINSDYFNWKYEVNPCTDSIAIYLAVFEQKVVAMRGMMGAEWRQVGP